MMVVTITTMVMIMWEMMMMLVVVVVVGASDKDRCSGILEIFLPPLIILSCNCPPLMSQHYSYAMHPSIFLGPQYHPNIYSKVDVKLLLDFRVTIADRSKAGLLETSCPTRRSQYIKLCSG